MCMDMYYVYISLYSPNQPSPSSPRQNQARLRRGGTCAVPGLREDLLTMASSNDFQWIIVIF